jgi:flagellin
MRINNNLMAMNTHRQYAINNNKASKATEKLSSGSRINRAGNDAAGLAISEKMRAQIRGLGMASKNSEDAISMIQTAEGALTETHGILQRMRELSVQSVSDTNDNTTDRAALNAEYQQLMSEINDIANKTQFNGRTLLNGTVGSAATTTATGLAAGVTIAADSTASSGTVNIATVSDWNAETFGFDLVGAASWRITAAVLTTPSAGEAYNGTYYLKAVGADMAAMTFSLVDEGGATAASTGAISVTAGSNSELDFGDYGTINATFGNDTTEWWLTSTYTGDEFTRFIYTISNGADAVATATIGGQSVSKGDTSVTLATGVTLDLFGLDAADWASQDALNTALFGSTTGSASVTVTAGVPGMTIQTGANTGDTMSLTMDDMTADGLSLSGTDIKTQEKASLAISSVNSAINAVSTQRAKFGALQNRLEHKINNLDTSAENLQAAESRIRDVDMATEMTEYTKNNILVQAATSMLAQANQAPQNVLSLLR